jgi:hypothetical protein
MKKYNAFFSMQDLEMTKISWIEMSSLNETIINHHTLKKTKNQIIQGW